MSCYSAFLLSDMDLMAKMPARATISKQAKIAPPKYEDIRLDLQQQRQLLLSGAGELLNHGVGTAALPDLSDQAAVESDQNFELRLRERDQRLLKKIDEALERIATQTYGICHSCGNEIPHERLKARPVTTLCIDCKTLQEQEEKLRR